MGEVAGKAGSAKTFVPAPAQLPGLTLHRRAPAAPARAATQPSEQEFLLLFCGKDVLGFLMTDILPTLLHARQAIFFPLGLVLAIGVTLHVLLRKREVATAVGWIGLAWFAPFTGAAAYYVLGVNRVQRRARQLRPGAGGPQAPASATTEPDGDTHLAALRAGNGRVSGRPLLGGNTVAVLQNGDAAYPAMLAAIAAAEHSVGLSSYLFQNDAWGGRFVDALAAAQRRGVAVRVLIDGIGGGWVRSPAYHALRRRGVAAARFLHSPLPWRMPFLNLRSHKKMLVVDGRVGFAGGLNIADGNVLACRTKHPVQDTHFRFEGPVVGQLTEAFAQDWLFASGETLGDAAWLPELRAAAQGGAASRVIDSGPDEDVEKIEFAVLQAVACARESIVVMTPYFLPDERLGTALSLAAMRGVRVDVVMPRRSNKMLVDWAARANVGPILSDGVRVWLSPPPFRHSKLMIVDGAWFLVGSCNWDIRSFRLNFELCVESYAASEAAALARFVMACRGEELTAADLAKRRLVVRLRDALARLCMPYL